jgi:hypothetical protein
MAEEKLSRDAILREKEELELEELRGNVEAKRFSKQQRDSARKENERSFAETIKKNHALWASCNHKKGGRDYAASQKRGDGDNHSIFIWAHPMGYSIVLCSRCHFLWEPGVTTKYMKDGKTPNPTKISWEDALRLPTDNTPSGSVMFGVRPALPTVAA